MALYRAVSTFFLVLCLTAPAIAATDIPLTVNMSEAVTVTGSPRVAVDVGGQTRYAAYTSGSNTNTLTFTLTPQAGDVDLDGIAVSSPIELNGGALKDNAGNNAALTFTPPNTSGIKVNYPSLGMDFVYDADGRYTLNGTVYNDLSSFLTAAGGTFTRASIATYYDSAGVLQTAASGAPRFDFDPVTHVAKGLLLEESRTNIITYSGRIDNAAWNGFSGTRVAGALAPDGSTDATTLTGPSAAVAARAALLATSTSMTYSVYVKYVSGGTNRAFLLRNGTTLTNFDSCLVNLSTGAFVNACTGWSIQSVGGGWFRLSYPRTTGISVGDALIVYFGTTGALATADSWLIWGAQLEAGAFSTSYIPTTSAAVTRQNDILLMPVGAWYNAAEGTVSGKYIPQGVGAGGVADLYYFRGTTLSLDVVSSRLSTTGNMYTSVADSAGTTVANLIGTTGLSVGSTIRAAQAFKLNDFALSVNGGAAVTDTSGGMPVPTQMAVGAASASQSPNGTVSVFKYYPQRVANAQLQLLTQ